VRRSSPAPGHVIFQDNRTGKVSYWQQDYHQSAADGDGVSTADYIHAMYFFLRQAKAKDVLMIGCGGGTLATMLHAKGVKVTIVDIHKLSFDIARDYFHLPAEIPCHVADGIAYLKKHRQRHDALILDAFGEGGMPAEFMQPAFFKLAKSRLKSRNALFLMNVIVADDDDRTPDIMVRAMRALWPKVRLLDRARPFAADGLQLGVELHQRFPDEFHPPVDAGEGVQNRPVEHENAHHLPAAPQGLIERRVVVHAKVAAKPHEPFGIGLVDGQ